MYHGNMPGVIQSDKRVRVEQNSFGKIQALCVWSLCFAFYQLWMHPKISTFSMCPGDGFCVQPRGEGRGPAVVRCRAWGCCQPGLLPVPIRMLCRESQALRAAPGRRKSVKVLIWNKKQFSLLWPRSLKPVFWHYEKCFPSENFGDLRILSGA